MEARGKVLCKQAYVLSTIASTREKKKKRRKRVQCVAKRKLVEVPTGRSESWAVETVLCVLSQGIFTNSGTKGRVHAPKNKPRDCGEEDGQELPGLGGEALRNCNTQRSGQMKSEL